MITSCRRKRLISPEKNLRLESISGPIIMNDLANAFHAYIEDKGIDFGKDKHLFGISHEEKRDAIIDVCNGYSDIRGA